MQLYTHYRDICALGLKHLIPVVEVGCGANGYLSGCYRDLMTAQTPDAALMTLPAAYDKSQGRRGTKSFSLGKSNFKVIWHPDDTLNFAQTLDDGRSRILPWSFRLFPTIEQDGHAASIIRRSSPPLLALMMHQNKGRLVLSKSSQVEIFGKSGGSHEPALLALHQAFVAAIIDEVERLFTALETARPLYNVEKGGDLAGGSLAYPFFMQSLRPFDDDKIAALLSGLPGYLISRMPDIEWAYLTIESAHMHHDGALVDPKVSIVGTLQNGSSFTLEKPDCDNILGKIHAMLVSPASPFPICEVIKCHQEKPYNLLSWGIKDDFLKLSAHDIIEQTARLEAALALPE